MILIMSVNPGFGGQSFIPEALKKIAAVRIDADRRNPGRDIMLEVDGGIKIDNIAAAAQSRRRYLCRRLGHFRPNRLQGRDRCDAARTGRRMNARTAPVCATSAPPSSISTAPCSIPRRISMSPINRMRAELALAPLDIDSITEFRRQGHGKPDPARAGRRFRPGASGAAFRAGAGVLPTALSRHQRRLQTLYPGVRRRPGGIASRWHAAGLRDQQTDRICLAAAGKNRLGSLF